MSVSLGEKVVIVAGGPSVTTQQIRAITKAHLEHKCSVIAVNDAAYLLPLANIIHGCDRWWWEQNAALAHALLPAVRTTLQEPISKLVHQYKYEHRTGIDARPGYVATGRNGGHQALNIAFHYKASKVGLVGFDFKPGSQNEEHWFGSHQGKHIQSSLYSEWVNNMNTAAEAIAHIRPDMIVVNCTPGSAIKCFPTSSIESFLK